ncbi:MAG: DHH family phosphoesterase [Oscillospiraceae bacterium]|nr:DHH family phosphoesterase [Oscillospiraceae bacterium]
MPSKELHFLHSTKTDHEKLICIADTLFKKNNFSILTHKLPDGDTLGSAFALFYALKKLKKRVKVLCSDPIPKKYSFLDLENISNTGLKESTIEQNECVISVDIADTKLLGENLEIYRECVDICIDHHSLNKQYAKLTYVNSSAAATAEIIYDIIKIMNIPFDKIIADCIYTGISTDTGSFKYSNTTHKTLEIAGKMLKYGARHNLISRKMFGEKTKTKIYLEKLVLETLEFFFSDKCAVICITKDILNKTKAKEEETEGLSGIPKSIKGVLIGITIREKEEKVFKISVRCDPCISALKLCSKFDGGGHPGAGGCVILGNLETVKEKILVEVDEILKHTAYTEIDQ